MGELEDLCNPSTNHPCRKNGNRSVNHKRRKVSANRDLPPHCRQIPPEIEGKRNVERSGLGCQLGVSVECKLHEIPRNLDQTKSSEFFEGLKLKAEEFIKTTLVEPPSESACEVGTSLKNLNGDNEIDSLKNLKSIEAEVLKGSDQAEFLDQFGSSKSKSEELLVAEPHNSLKGMDQPLFPDVSEAALSGMDQQEHVGSLEDNNWPIQAKVESTSGLDHHVVCHISEGANQSQVMVIPNGLEQKIFIHSQDDTVKMHDVCVPVVISTKRNVLKKYPPRRISCPRDFPSNCGKDVLTLPEKEHQEAVTSGSQMSNGEVPSTDMDGTANVKNVAGKLEKNIEIESKSKIHVEFGFRSTRDETEDNTDNDKVCSSSENKLGGEDIEVSNKIHINAGYEGQLHERDTNSQSSGEKADKGFGNSVVGVDEESGKQIRDKKSVDYEGKLIGELDSKNAISQSDGEISVAFKEKSVGEKVGENLRLFQTIYRKLLHEEEAKSNLHLQTTSRIDMLAYELLKKKKNWINTGMPILGNVPGIEVGDEFYFRVELVIVGLHRLLQSGIDYFKQGGLSLAASVVASGGYADEMDSSDVLIYSGQGGQPVGLKKQAEDQKLQRGNLALKNSMDSRTPVRVIRGFKELRGGDSQYLRGKITTTYIYDGLYFVEKYWLEKGQHGCSVFKFQLRRLPGQPELALKELKLSKKSVAREGVCIDDISQGKEKMPICAVNTIDEERPMPFKYVAEMIYPSWYNPTPPRGCDCVNGCSDSKKCVCVVKNGGEIPFNHDGAIVEAKPLVFECGPSCSCPPSCHNRVSQHGIKYQLEIFKTESRGWGVRSLISIPSGSFICEYAGELLRDKDAEQRTGNDEYLFDIGHNYNDQSLWDRLSTLTPPDLQSSYRVADDGEYAIDAAEYGNVGRFINHSCSPNLYAQNVLYDHDDKSMPHIMLFAAENIPPLQELTYDYNYTIGQVRDSNGNIKQKNCYCGSSDCTGRLY